MGKKKKKPETTFEQFSRMSEWLMKDMDKEPKDSGEMMAQSFGAVGRTLIFIGWLYAKTLGFIIRKIIGGIKMVLGRGKKKKKADKNSPAYVPPELQQQLQQQIQQMQNVQQQPAQDVQQSVQQPAAIPTEFPSQTAQPEQPAAQLPVPPVPPEMLPPTQPPAQPPVQPPAQPPVQPPMVRPADRPAPPQPMATPAGNILEQLMLTDLSLGEHIQLTDSRLDKIEAYLKALDAQMNDIYARLNMVQGIQPSSKERIKFS